MKPSSQSNGHSKTYKIPSRSQDLIKKIVFGTVVSLALIPLPSFAQGPSYDCAEAKSEVETTICENPDLAQAELTYTNAFLDTKLLFDDAVKKDLARILLDRRNTCRTDTNCLSAVFNYGTGFWQGTAEVRITDGLISNQKSLDDTRVAFNRLSEIARKDIQTQLKSDKFYDGKIDGEYGIATWKALKAFGNATGREQSPIDALNLIVESAEFNDENECNGCEQTSVSVTSETDELPQNTTVGSQENSETQETGSIAQSLQKGIEAYYKRDDETAKRELLPLANSGNAKAKAIIGRMYMKGWGFPVDVQEGLRLCTETANQGEALGENCIGNAYLSGLGVAKNDAEALKWYQKAADQGLDVGQTNVGEAYAEGRGIQQDFAEALKWYQKAADQGFASAQARIGYLYYYGQGVTQDYAEAIKWYNKAAEQENSDAYGYIGYAYLEGKGVNQDYSEAVKWYRKAADQGDSFGQSSLGWAYENGKGVNQDYSEAVKWYRKAADQGNSVAQRALGNYFLWGIAGQQDYDEALNWYKKAADQGNKEAIEFLESEDERQQFLNGEPTQRFINSASFVTTGGLEEDLRKPSAELRGRFGNCTAVYEEYFVHIMFEARAQIWYDFNKVNWKSATIETIGASKSFVSDGEVGVVEYRLAPNTSETAKQMLMLAGIFDGKKSDQIKFTLSVTEERYTAAVQDLMAECPGVQSTY